jgi:hypothetical protein
MRRVTSDHSYVDEHRGKNFRLLPEDTPSRDKKGRILKHNVG